MEMGKVGVSIIDLRQVEGRIKVVSKVRREMV